MHFYVACALATLTIGWMLHGHLTRIFPEAGRTTVASIIVALLVVPTVAVVLERHTGLIYSLEILAGLVASMVLSMRPAVRAAIQRLEHAVDGTMEVDRV